MVQCKSTIDCGPFEYCDPNFHHCDKCELLCARKTGTLGECQELCPRYLSKGILTATAVTTEAAITSILHRGLDRKEIGFQLETPLDILLLSLVLCIVILLLLLMLLSLQVMYSSRIKLSLVARKNMGVTRGKGLPLLGNYQQRKYKSRNQTVAATTFTDIEETNAQPIFVKPPPKDTVVALETEELSSTQHTRRHDVVEAQETRKSEVSALISPQQEPDGMDDDISGHDRISEHQLPEELQPGVDTDLNNRHTLDEGIPNAGELNSSSSGPVSGDIPNGISQTPMRDNVAISSTTVHGTRNDLNKDSLLKRLPDSSHGGQDGEVSQGISQQQLNITVPEVQHTSEEPKKPRESDKESAEARHQRFKINKHVYEILRRLPYVDGYFSEGNKIDVFADLDVNTMSWVLRDLTKQTGQPADKFYVRHTTEQ